MRPWFERGVPVMQIYGLSESCPTAIVVLFDEAERKIGSIGKPVTYCEARIVNKQGQPAAAGEPGEIALRGPNMFAGYWKNPTATREAIVDGWFRTGDIGHMDDEGYFYIDDRVKDVIIVGASNVYPAELDTILAETSAIAEAAVVGRPDEELGEVPVAFVALREGHVMTADDVIACFEGRLATYKHPREVIFMDKLPRNAVGKVQKFRLRRQAADGLVLA